LTKGRIAELSALSAAKGFVWPWPHLIMNLWAHKSQAPKWHLDHRFSHFGTAHPRDFPCFSRSLPTPQISPFMDPIYYVVSWAHPSQLSKQGLNRFCHFWH